MSTTAASPDPCQIIIAWTDSDAEFVRERRTDLGESPVFRDVTVVKAVVWLNEGTAADAAKAHAYADPLGYKVFTYALDVADALGAARKAMLASIPVDRQPRGCVSTCSACGRPLDPESADIVARHPDDFPNGALGACCHGKKGEEDHGWGEAPEHGHDF